MPDVLLSDDNGALLVTDDGDAVVAYTLPGAGFPVHQPDDVAKALMRLLPRGRAWPRDPGAVLTQVVAALAPIWTRLEQRASDLVVDAFPATAVFLLPEWEAALGLPDPCAGPTPSISERQRNVVAQLVATGGQSVPYVRLLLAALGRTGTVIEFAPFRVDRSSVESPLSEDGWAYAWEVVVDPLVPAMQGVAASDAVVTCVLRRMCPAHTVLILAFTTP